MKNIAFCLSLLAFPLATTSAKIWLVDNTGNPNADFTTLTAAVASTSVQNGDTVQLAGSPLTYSGSFTLNKRLVFIGPGYFLSENVAQANLNSATVGGQIDLFQGASGSIFMGITIDNGGGSCFRTSNPNASTNNIVIARCRLFAGNSAIDITNFNNSTGWIIAQNYIVSNGDRTINIQSANAVSNIIIANNYIRQNNFSTPTGGTAIFGNASSSMTIRHNVVQGRFEVQNSLIENNIQASTNNFSATNSTVRNNLSEGTGLPSGNGNQNSVNMQAVFLGTGSTDGRWQLRSGSPAIGAGFNGVNCGMFGGSEPYILSGVPSIPRIIEFNAPTTGSSQSGLPIQLRVRAQN